MKREDDDGRRVETALAGQCLYGDDFSPAEVSAWFADEKEGYFTLYAGLNRRRAESAPRYGYSALAEQHGYRWLPRKNFAHVLGIGCADGAELVPLLPRCRRITILEPSDGYAAADIAGTPVRYVKPDPSGIMPFEDGAFDLVVCFGVLHHIPNVSTVIGEIFRVLCPGGTALLREPTQSMGDWRHVRQGLTKRERGIPCDIMKEIVRRVGFQVEHQAECMFSLLTRLSRMLNLAVWTSKWSVRLDRVLCSLPIWSRRYHARTVWHKIRPTAFALVLRKPHNSSVCIESGEPSATPRP